MSDDTTTYVVIPFNPLRSEPHHASEHPISPVHSISPSASSGPEPPSYISFSEEASSNAVEAEKAFIRERILYRSNAELINEPDPSVMAELCALGSDLNINAFVCNFRVKVKSLGADPDEWVLNEDVEEANYLNRCIFDRLSVTDVGQLHMEGDDYDEDLDEAFGLANKLSNGGKRGRTPMFLSSTILKADDYGDCLKRLKERAGLETESGRDLFVLRNVVMSPFQAGADFVAKIAETFKEVMQDCLKVRASKLSLASPVVFPCPSKDIRFPPVHISKQFQLTLNLARRRQKQHYGPGSQIHRARHGQNLPRLPTPLSQSQRAAAAHPGS